MDRFWSKVNKTETCWLWMAARTYREGYGRFTDRGPILAHVWAYQDAYGPVPDGLEVHHTCEVKYCVNPAHLQAVTHTENVRATSGRRRGPGSPKTGRPRNPDGTFVFCPQEHPLFGDNLYVRPSGARECRKCNNARAAKKYRT